MTGVQINDVFVQLDKLNQVCELRYINGHGTISKGRHYTCGHLLNTFKGQPIDLCIDKLEKAIDDAEKNDNE